MTSWSSPSMRTCHNDVLPEKNAALPPPCDEGLDGVAHALGPVLVVPDREVQARAVQHLGVLLQIGIRAHADLEALALGPLEEGQLPVGPTGRAGVAREMVDLDVADVRGVLRVGLARSRSRDDPCPAACTGSPPPSAAAWRPGSRRCRGSVRRSRCRRATCWSPARARCARPGRGTHDEEGVVAPDLLADVDLHDDLVVAGAPGRIDVQGQRHGPPAPLRGGVLRRLVLVGRDGVGAEHDLAPSADPCHLDPHRPAARRRQVQADLLARADRLRPAVPRHHLACHGATLTRPDDAAPGRNGSGPSRSRSALPSAHDRRTRLPDRPAGDRRPPRPVCDRHRHPPLGRSRNGLRPRRRPRLPLRRRHPRTVGRGRRVAGHRHPLLHLDTAPRRQPCRAPDRRTPTTRTSHRRFYNPNGAVVDGEPWLFVVGGAYHDRLVRTPEGWRIAHRVEETVWWDNPMPGLPR